MKKAYSLKSFLPLVVLALAGLIGAAQAAAGGLREYRKADFQAARSSGAPVVLVFHASWCPVCAQQKLALEKVIEEKEFGKIQVFLADFDSSFKLKREMGVASQSTLILFRSGRELGRLIGVTDPGEIRRFLRKGLQ